MLCCRQRADHFEPLLQREKHMQVVDRSGSLLFASQFTLFARTVKGTKPDFHLAMAPAQVWRSFYFDSGVACTLLLCISTTPLSQALEFYASFVERMRAAYVSERVHDGIFGAVLRAQNSSLCLACAGALSSAANATLVWA